MQKPPNSKLRVNLDISNFFPSITEKVVTDIWRWFFNFSPSVAQLLTKLTTYNGFVPQGSPTSSYLANLVFWDVEPNIVEKFQKNGFAYTRYVDDVIISSKTKVPIKKLYPIFNSVFGMFRSKGVKANRNKIDISTSGYNMQVHNLNINSNNPTLPKNERKRIKAAVRECESEYLNNRASPDYKKLWERTIGRVNFLNQLHPTEALPLRTKLQIIRPEVIEK